VSFVFIGEAMALNEKHKIVLELYKRNKYSVEDMATKSGFSEQYVNDLIIGTPQAGAIGQEFQAEIRKVNKDIEARISWKNNLCREKLVNKLLSWTDAIGGGQDLDTKTKHKCLVDAINALNKAMPYQVNIENYTWKDGMTTEEAVNEFKRIKGLARAAAIRRRVSEFAANGTEQGFVPDGQIGESPEDSQDTVLPGQPQADGISQEPLLDEGNLRGE
jgi:predicted DNA-binding protein YlxM (UPF0122 family)